MNFREAVSFLRQGYIMISKLPKDWNVPDGLDSYLYYLDKDRTLIQCSIMEFPDGSIYTRAFVAGKEIAEIKGIVVFPEMYASCRNDFNDTNNNWNIVPQNLIYKDYRCSLDMKWFLPRLPEDGRYPNQGFGGRRESSWVSPNALNRWVYGTPGCKELKEAYDSELTRKAEEQHQAELKEDMEIMKNRGFICGLTFDRALDIIKKNPRGAITFPDIYFDPESDLWVHIKGENLVETHSDRGHLYRKVICNLTDSYKLQRCYWALNPRQDLCVLIPYPGSDKYTWELHTTDER